MNSNRVISLGFNIWTFSDEYFNDLRWFDQYTDELVVKSTNYGGETDMYCNNTNKDTTHIFK